MWYIKLPLSSGLVHTLQARLTPFVKMSCSFQRTVIQQHNFRFPCPTSAYFKQALKPVLIMKAFSVFTTRKAPVNNSYRFPAFLPGRSNRKEVCVSVWFIVSIVWRPLRTSSTEAEALHMWDARLNNRWLVLQKMIFKVPLVQGRTQPPYESLLLMSTEGPTTLSLCTQDA